ncbi:hypothetical protein GH714_019464 [Hevea brasiliensis]|uniref:NB-ARC domain-containing protein n=1 Tax=Hevea brasiliensis TaxID=3981 RepID=A0A6A6LKH3_HEVBR|nr:hypothetical protein GH714_019464 [Hevea brasiliensis]
MHWDLRAVSSLLELTIDGYDGVDMVSFPGKMLLPSTLTSLNLFSLENLKFLDKGLLHLTSLKKLRIDRCYNLQSLPEEGLPSSITSLDIVVCRLLQPKCEFGGEYWPLISQIPQLWTYKFIQSHSLYQNEALHIPSLNEISTDCNEAPLLPALSICRCHEGDSQASICYKVCVGGDWKRGCMQWDLQTFHSLVKIVIESCDDVEAFPGEMLLPSTLISLQINGFQNLKSIDYKGLQDLKNLTVVNCPKLELFLGGVLPSQLESLGICKCSKLVAHLMHWDLRAASSLLELTIDGYDGVDMVSFPGKMLLPSTLTSLNLISLENLKFLDKGLLHLTSLKNLGIGRCYNLQSRLKKGCRPPLLR